MNKIMKINTDTNYNMSFIPDNHNLIDDFTIIKRKLHDVLKFSDIASLEIIIHDDKYFDFASEMVSRLIKVKNSSEFNKQCADFIFLLRKADLFNTIKSKNSNLSNCLIYNIVHWAKNKKELDKIIKDSKNILLHSKSDYESSFFNYGIINGFRELLKTASIFIGFFGAVYLGFFMNYTYQKAFNPEKFELVKHKEKEYLNTFNQIKDKYNPKNKVDYYVNVDNVIKNFSRFDPIVKYKKENPSLYNNDFSYNLDNELMKKGFEVTIADTNNYILKANNYKKLIDDKKQLTKENFEKNNSDLNSFGSFKDNYEKLLKIKKLNLTPENTNIFTYSERLIISDLVITEEELNILKEIK
jgi:hypothetical protein